jgi:hypothetical protein
MDSRTLEALLLSIEHWRENEASPAEAASTGPDDCPLCELFLKDRCSGCPIANAVGDFGCRGTPYEAAVASRDAAKQSGRDADQEAWRAAARAELEFLESLLPRHERVEPNRGDEGAPSAVHWI